MKLFQRLLVAPAAIGLLSPLASNATEVNLNEISNYSDVENLEIVNSFNEQDKVNKLIAGGEGLVSDISSDSFSETTTASFSADMAIGAVDGDATGEAVNAVYGFQIDLNTSFTGEDSLDISIDAGSNQASLDQLDLNGGSDALTVDGISYTFPLGDKTTVFVGDSVDGSSLYSTACVYGGQTVNIDDCGNSGAAMASPITGKTAAGASYDFGNGWTAALGYEGQGSISGSGLFTKEGTDIFGGQVTYTGDNYGVSLTYSDFEGTNDTAYTAFNAYYTPESAGSLPSISAGYETGSVEGGTDTEQWMVGLQWDEIGAGTLGVALATDGHQAENASDLYVYEAFYSYPVNDGMTITPVVFIREASSTVDETGVVLKTSFSF